MLGFLLLWGNVLYGDEVLSDDSTGQLIGTVQILSVMVVGFIFNKKIRKLENCKK